MLKEDSVNREPYNIGISVLKIWMCFEVVLDHFGHVRGECMNIFVKMFYTAGGLAVPSFMLMSFILNEKIFLLRDKKIIKKRLNRLAYPHIVWTLVYSMIGGGGI